MQDSESSSKEKLSIIENDFMIVVNAILHRKKFREYKI